MPWDAVPQEWAARNGLGLRTDEELAAAERNAAREDPDDLRERLRAELRALGSDLRQLALGRGA